MAYSAANLTLEFDGGAGFAKSYRYVTTDTLATVMASGYFTPLSAYAPAIGDTIDVIIVDAVAVASRTSTSGTTRIIVATNDGTTVTTTTAGLVGSSNAVVATTATTLQITRALHNGRVVVVNSAAPIAITLPQATGTGATYEFYIGVVATATAHTIKVGNTTDVMAGFQFTVTTSSSNVEGFATTATDDTISVNGTTKGGIVGDRYIIKDVATGIFSVTMFSSSTGTEATPFSATV